MTYSPNRKNFSFPNKREPYTQNRQENSNQLNFIQNSPTVRSPRLNDESEYTNHKDPATVHELKSKLEIVLRHNSHLLNENATLSEMVNSLRMELDARANKEEA